MNPRPRVTRRGFLGSVAVVAVVASVRGQPWRSLVAFRGRGEAERLVGLFSHAESAGIVGRAYLRIFPDEGRPLGS